MNNLKAWYNAHRAEIMDCATWAMLAMSAGAFLLALVCVLEVRGLA